MPGCSTASRTGRSHRSWFRCLCPVWKSGRGCLHRCRPSIRSLRVRCITIIIDNASVRHCVAWKCKTTASSRTPSSISQHEDLLHLVSELYDLASYIKYALKKSEPGRDFIHREKHTGNPWDSFKAFQKSDPGDRRKVPCSPAD